MVYKKSIEIIKLNDNNRAELDKIGVKDENMIYFIYIYDINLINKIFSDNKNKLIIFSKEKIDNTLIQKSIQVPEEKKMKNGDEYKEKYSLFEPNEFIIFQHYDDVKLVLRK